VGKRAFIENSIMTLEKLV